MRASYQKNFFFFIASTWKKIKENEREQKDVIDEAVEGLELQKVQSQSNVKQVQL